jgi:hypothetical protein
LTSRASRARRLGVENHIGSLKALLQGGSPPQAACGLRQVMGNQSS